MRLEITFSAILVVEFDGTSADVHTENEIREEITEMLKEGCPEDVKIEINNLEICIEEEK